MKKRLLSILLAALMVFSLLPTVAFAGEVTDCTYTQKVTTPENGKTYGMKLNCKDKGEFTFEASGTDWNIKNSEGKYLNAANGKLVLGDTAATAWTYKNGAFSTSVKTTQKNNGYWLGFIYVPGRGTKTVTTTYYLSTVTDGAKLSTYYVGAELFEEVSGEHSYKYVNKCNGTHDKICKNCGAKTNETCVYDQEGSKCICGAYDPSNADVKISVDVKEKTAKQYVGFFPFGYYKNVKTYTATIKTEATGVKVTKVQYQLNGGRWTTGTNVSSDKPIETLNVRAWDSNGKLHEYKWPEAPAPVSYNVTAQVQGDYGTATAKVGGVGVTKANAGASVVFAAETAAGFEFDYWEVVSGGIDIDSVKNNAEITVTMPNTTLTLKAHFKAVNVELSVELEDGPFIYCADQIKPDVISVTDEDGNSYGPSDYTVTYGQNTNAGEEAGSVTVTLNSPRTGEGSESFDIQPRALDAYPEATVTVPEDGVSSNEDIVVKVEGRTLVEGIDYEITIWCDDPDSAPTVKYAQIDGKGNYSGTAWSDEFTWITYTVTFADAEHGAIYDAATSGSKVTEITVDSGSAVAVNGNKITIGDTDYYAIADSGYKFKDFSATVPETITAATTITPVFEEELCTVSVNVADDDSYEPIEGATAVFTTTAGQTYSGVTGSDGIASIPVPKNIEGTWTVSAEGYDDFTSDPKTYTADTTYEWPYLKQKQLEMCTIYGYIYQDEQQNEPLEGATVKFTANGQDYSTTSGSFGFFTLDVPKNIEGSWSISADGYVTYTGNSTYTSSSSNEYFTLEPQNS